jgi:hypothetical protein
MLIKIHILIGLYFSLCFSPLDFNFLKIGPLVTLSCPSLQYTNRAPTVGRNENGKPNRKRIEKEK